MNEPMKAENGDDKPEVANDDGFNQVAVSTSPSWKSNHLWWQILALLVVSALAVYTGTAFDEEFKKLVPEGRRLASTYNKQATGLKGLFKLTQELHLPVAVWEEPYRHLKHAKGMLVIIAPTESLQPFQTEQILTWVRRGNNLVYIDDLSFDMTKHFARRLHVTVKQISPEGSKAPDVDIVPEATFAETKHVKNLRLASIARVEGGKPLAKDQHGALLTVIEYGKGRVLFGTCPSILANSTVAKKEFWGNFQLISNWFRTTGGTIYFDEYSHGFSGGTNVFIYLSRGPIGLISAQLLIILIVAIISESQRFGAARTIESRRKISNLEFINGLSHAYRRARANPAVLEILFHAFKNKLSRALAISPHEPVDRLQEAWSQSKFQTSHNLNTLLGQYEEFMTRREVSDTDLKTMIDTCDKITETTQETSAALMKKS